MMAVLGLKKYVLLAVLPVLMIGCTEDNQFNVDIDRIYHSPEEYALLMMAEQVCPEQEAVLAAAAPEEVEAIENGAGEGCLWWYATEPLKAPYALTWDAVDYFQHRVEELRTQPSLLIRYPAAWLHYRAHIEFADTAYFEGTTYENVYVVRMTLYYDEVISKRSALGFNKKRFLILTPDGEVLAAGGDGPIEWIVS